MAAEICPHISCLDLFCPNIQMSMFKSPRYKIERLNQSETNRQDNS